MKHFHILGLWSILVFCFLMGCTSSSVSEEETIEEPPDTVILKENKDIDIYRHRDTAAGGNDREAYIWHVMDAALKATEVDYGSYAIETVADINQEREDYELIEDTGVITVISDSLNQNNLDNLSRLEFPIIKGLLGYRVFFIDENRKEEFATIKTLEDLKAFQFGIGLGWNDKIVLEHAGIAVYEEAEYAMLFRDVTHGVFDIFSRGINEILGEYEVYGKQYENLAIEDHVLLYYPLPRYFWFSQSENGQRLKARLDVGLKRIVEDGTLDKIFESYFLEGMEVLNLKNRTLIELENPFYTDEFKMQDTPYLYNPFQ